MRNPATSQARTDLADHVSVYSGPGRSNHLGPVKGQLKAQRAVLHPEHEKDVDLAVLLLESPAPFATATIGADLVGPAPRTVASPPANTR